jgi:hypothetical protein
MEIKTGVRRGLLAVSRRMPDEALTRLGNFVRELELGAWMRANDLVLDRVAERREELFGLVADEVGEAPALYLEFGVANGDATRIWTRLLKHPETVLHGFDSFEGLPEKWTNDRPKGMFSTDGALPQIDDPRVRFFKGWFEKTLDQYVPPNRSVLIINMDADLYSSTIFVLRKLRYLFRAGTFLYFDEFSSYGHEERAFREFVEESRMTFRLRGGTRNLLHVLFQCVEPARLPTGERPLR